LNLTLHAREARGTAKMHWLSLLGGKESQYQNASIQDLVPKVVRVYRAARTYFQSQSDWFRTLRVHGGLRFFRTLHSRWRAPQSRSRTRAGKPKNFLPFLCTAPPPTPPPKGEKEKRKFFCLRRRKLLPIVCAPVILH